MKTTNVEQPGDFSVEHISLAFAPREHREGTGAHLRSPSEASHAPLSGAFPHTPPSMPTSFPSNSLKQLPSGNEKSLNWRGERSCVHARVHRHAEVHTDARGTKEGRPRESYSLECTAGCHLPSLHESVPVPIFRKDAVIRFHPIHSTP